VTTVAIPIPPDVVNALVELVRESLTVEPRYLSKQALAARLGVDERTIKTWRSKGLPGVRVGKEVMYEITAVERWIEQHR
jgi:hypothetical protein